MRDSCIYCGDSLVQNPDHKLWKHCRRCEPSFFVKPPVAGTTLAEQILGHKPDQKGMPDLQAARRAAANRADGGS